jgi:hypothetical protein
MPLLRVRVSVGTNADVVMVDCLVTKQPQEILLHSQPASQPASLHASKQATNIWKYVIIFLD